MMLNKKIVICLSLLVFMPALANEPNQCEGSWEILPVKNNRYSGAFEYTGFPAYPVSLEVKGTEKNSVEFIDNHNRTCSINYLIDQENQSVEIKHCLPMSDPEMKPIYYKLTCVDNRIIGTVNSFKELFDLTGVKVK